VAKYSMIVSWSEDDNCYLVSVPDLPGCMADGETPQKPALQSSLCEI